MSTTIDKHHQLDQLPDDDPRVSVGLYTTSEAARYLGLPISTLHSWISPKHGGNPLVTTVARRGYEADIPFIGFAEAFVLQAARRAGVLVIASGRESRPSRASWDCRMRWRRNFSTPTGPSS